MLTKGERIRRAIEWSGLSQKQVATFCGVTPQAVTGWIKTAKISSKYLERVASLTKTRMEWLETGKGAMEDHGALDDALALGKGYRPPGSIPIPGPVRVRIGQLVEYLHRGQLSEADFEAVWNLVEHLARPAANDED